jgi:hypothetical protein
MCENAAIPVIIDAQHFRSPFPHFSSSFLFFSSSAFFFSFLFYFYLGRAKATTERENPLN